MKTLSKVLLALAMLSCIPLAISAQIQMVPLYSIPEESTTKAPTDGNWLMLLPQSQAEQWTSGYCYGLAAASALMQQVTDVRDLAIIVACIEAIERQSLLTTQLSLYIGTVAARYGAPWYTEPLYEMCKGVQ